MIIIAKREKEQKHIYQLMILVRFSAAVEVEGNWFFQNSECRQQHLLEPVGDRHHYIERSQEEDKMEVRVAVDGTLPLVIQHILAWANLLLIIVILKKEKLQKDAQKNV